MTNNTLDDKPLQIQAGKRYVRRDGEITPPMPPKEGGFWQDPESARTYGDDGAWIGTETPYPEDLISEYIEPTAEPLNIEGAVKYILGTCKEKPTAEPQDEWGPWIGYNGVGDQPVDDGVMVEVVYEAGSGFGAAIDSAGEIDWDWTNAVIIAYRIKTPEPEPREYKLQLNTEHDWIEDFYAPNEYRGIIVTVQGDKIDIRWADA